MKLFIVLAAITLAQAAKLDRTYLPPNAQAAAGSEFLQTPRQSNGFLDQTGAFANGFSNPNAYAQNGDFSGFEARPERAQAAFERNAAILRQDNSNDGETYAYAYETENGIYGEENGVASNGVQAQGGYSYTGDDGKVYSVKYTADENGFQPQGDHLPTSPPIPEEILKALEQNARDEAAGIYDDGSYNEAKYAGDNEEQYYNDNAQAINYNNAQSNNYNNADSVVTNTAILRNDAAQSAGIQKAYLPPFAQRENSFIRKNAAQSGSSAAEIKKSYLPPFAQRNQADSVITNNAFLPNDAAQSTSSSAGIQKAYLPPFTQRDNSFSGNDATQISSSVTGVQKSYLPPFAQRNNQRSAARQPTFNARDGYRY